MLNKSKYWGGLPLAITVYVRMAHELLTGEDIKNQQNITLHKTKKIFSGGWN
jgi:hypothetical protein